MGELRSFQEGDLTVRFQVPLVPDKQNDEVGVGEVPGIRQPRSQRVVRLPGADVIDQKSPGCSSIIALCHRPRFEDDYSWAGGDVYGCDCSLESFLASSIPDLELHLFASNGDDLGAKFNSNCMAAVLFD